MSKNTTAAKVTTATTVKAPTVQERARAFITDNPSGHSIADVAKAIDANGDSTRKVLGAIVKEGGARRYKDGDTVMFIVVRQTVEARALQANVPADVTIISAGHEPAEVAPIVDRAPMGALTMLDALATAEGTTTNWCTHCNGYGSSLKEDGERCSACGGTGLATTTVDPEPKPAKPSTLAPTRAVVLEDTTVDGRHRIVSLAEGPHAGARFALDAFAEVGEIVVVTFVADDQFAHIVTPRKHADAGTVCVACNVGTVKDDGTCDGCGVKVEDAIAAATVTAPEAPTVTKQATRATTEHVFAVRTAWHSDKDAIKACAAVRALLVAYNPTLRREVIRKSLGKLSGALHGADKDGRGGLHEVLKALDAEITTAEAAQAKAPKAPRAPRDPAAPKITRTPRSANETRAQLRIDGSRQLVARFKDDGLARGTAFTFAISHLPDGRRVVTMTEVAK